MTDKLIETRAAMMGWTWRCPICNKRGIGYRTEPAARKAGNKHYCSDKERKEEAQPEIA